MSAELGRKKKSLMIPMRVFCLLLAIAIWVLVVNLTSDSFEDTFEIDIRVEGNETLSDRGISIYDRSESKVSVLVRGQREQIRRLKSSDFRAYIDVGSLETAGKHNVDVKLSVPEEVAVISYTPSSVEISVDQIKTMSRIPEVEFRNYSKEKKYEIKSYRIEPQVLNVSGPGDIVNRISKIKAVANLGGISITDSFENIPEALVFLDEKGNVIPQDFITLSSEQIHIFVSVNQIRPLSLGYEYEAGFDASRIAAVEFTPSTLDIKGEKAALDQFSRLSVITIGKNTPADSEIPLSMLRLPEGIVFTDSDISGKTVKVHIRLKPEDTTTSEPVTTASPADSSALSPDQPG